ncbi:MAG: hypothetical protein WAU91_18675 [Desulfatitalea sp.]
MKEPAGLFVELFACSACFWVLFTLFKTFSVSRFIVKRYEQETDLLSTDFFKKLAPFVRYLPNLNSTGAYALHLVMCTWAWRLYRKKKAFCDIDDPKQVTRFFTSKEIRRAQLLLVYFLIAGLHLIAYFVFHYIWPEHFS